MKKREVELKLKSVGDEFVPDILDKVLANRRQTDEGATFTMQKNCKNSKKRLIAILAASIILLCGILSGGHLYCNADGSLVYLDINPTIELTINTIGSVKALTPKNDDAKALIGDSVFTGMAVEDAIERILELAVEKNYINSDSDDNGIIISISNNNINAANKQMKKISGKANSFFNGKGIKCKIDKEVGNKSNNNELEQGISPGKLKLIQSIIEIDSAYTVESLKDLSVKDLQKLLKKLSGKAKN